MIRKIVLLAISLVLSIESGYSQEIEFPFASDIKKFKERDKADPPPANAVLFIGSSSFTFWKDVQEYFPENTIINRGFGGSTLSDQIRYVSDIVFPYSPRHIVIYCGENDLAASDTVTSQDVIERFMILFGLIRAELPGARITYVSMKPSPSRWQMASRFMEANSGIRDFLAQQSNTGFVNVWDSMLNENHMPDSALFTKDMLHMNADGYRIWQKMIEPELMAFIDDLIGRMTLAEKAGQLNLFAGGWFFTGPALTKNSRDLIAEGKVGAILNAYGVDYVTPLQRMAVEESRLGIPLLFGLDVVHGHRTIFPIPLAQSCSWDLESIERSERIAATEATAEGINWVFAPMVDIARDPRWGRVMEGAGEDAYLGSMIAAARVRGFQGKSLADENSVMACVKHFAAYGAPQAGRDYHTVDMSDRSLMEWYLPPYRAAVDAGTGSVMTSFNEIAGIPSSSNEWLLTSLLKEQWGFNGFVVSDWTSIPELIPHGVAADSVDAARLAINAGLDMDMEGSVYLKYLADLVTTGKVPEETLNRSVRRVLEAKYRLGLFDDPYRYCNKAREESEMFLPEYLSFARNFAAESMVLLKNSNNTLPISDNTRTIAVIGPLADSKQDMLGGWSAAGQWEKSVTLFEAVRERAGSDMNIMYEKGCDIDGSSVDGIRKAMAVARKADFVILALGERQDMSGEAASKTDISLPGVQMELARKVLSTGVPAAVVLFNGRPLVIAELDSIAPAILEAWFGGSQAGNAVADVLFGDVNPSGKLTMTFPRSMGQIPVFYSVKNTGRPWDPRLPEDYFKSRYQDSPNTPLYPFGYGLSYTTFSYSDVSLNKTSYSRGDLIEASVNVTNTGDCNGEEVVQLYVRDRVGDVTRPLKELKAFKKVAVSKGETVKVTFALPLDALSYYHKDMKYCYDPGEFELYIGQDSYVSDYVIFTVK